MLFAIDFDDQPRRAAAEIYDVRIERNLTTKLPAVELSILQNRPQSLHSFGGIATQCTRTSEWYFWKESRRREVGHRWDNLTFARDMKWW
ncbi:MAG: hypothetical protein WCA22_14360 [Candidatus Binatus sp.]